jgi:NADH-quinone oxidoreductase chain G
MLKVTVNNQEVYLPRNTSVLEGCKHVGIDIPRFCYHERLSVAGNCRMCLVEIEKSPKPVASCAMPIMNNMVVYTDSPLVRKARENVVETLLLNHPLDCPICDQGGECDLQDQARLFGGDYSRYHTVKRSVEDKYCGPLIKTIMTRCIHCTRCVRFISEVAGLDALGTLHRGKETEIGSYLERVLDTEISGNLIDLCPVGALTSKPYAFLARPWELRTVESIDFNDSLGSNLYVNFKESEIVRILPRLNEDLNQEWISDKARYSYDANKRQRLVKLMLRQGPKFKSIDWVEGLEIFKSHLAKKKSLFLIDSNIDSQTLNKLKDIDSQNNIRVRTVSKATKASLNSATLLNNIDNSDFCLLLGVNPKIEAAILNIRLRSRWQKGNFHLSSIGSITKANLPTNFIGFNTLSFSNFLVGKSELQNLISRSKFPFILVGKNFLNRYNSTFLNTYFKELNIASKFMVLGSKVNSFGSGLLNFRSYTLDDSIWAETIYFINLDEISLVKKLMNNFSGFKVWIHTHGSRITSKANLVVPISSYLETEAFYFNVEGKVQKTLPALKAIGDARSLTSLLDLFYYFTVNKIWLNLTSGFILKLKTFPQANSFSTISEEKFIGIEKGTHMPLKSNLEDFYLSSGWTKASAIMAQCSYLARKAPSNFIF